MHFAIAAVVCALLAAGQAEPMTASEAARGALQPTSTTKASPSSAAGTAAPTGTPTAAGTPTGAGAMAPPQAAPSAAVGFGSPALDAPGGLAGASPAPKHALEISGYAVLSGAWTQADSRLLTVGRNNGFVLGDARLEITGRPAESLWLYLSFDGAAAIQGDNPVAGRRTVELRDAYGVYSPGGHLRFQAGQFKAPQDVELLMEHTELKFASRSIVSEGAGPPFGYSAPGLGLDRQLGVGVGTDRIPLGSSLGLTTQVAVMNGNGANQLLNDTQYPSAVGRVALDLSGRVTFGLDGYFQPRGSGSQPTYFRDNLVGVGGDVRVEQGPLHVLLLAQFRNTRHVTFRGRDEQSLGLSAEGAYRLGFVEPALRVSYLDPSNQVPTSKITWATAGVNLYAPNAPARLSVDFTHRIEQEGRALDNDGLEVAAQVRF